jgi:GT2 family glycosyltransferase
MRASVVIAAHNEGDRLYKTVESILSTAPVADFEVVVVDDASADHSAQELTRRFPETRILRNSERQGASPSKDFGARNSRGELLVFLDAHTKPEVGALEQLAADVERLEGYALVTPAVPALDTEKWENKMQQIGHGYRMTLEKLECGWIGLEEMVRRDEFYESPALIGCAVAMKRSTYEDLKGFDIHMFEWGVEDIDFGLKAWLMGGAILHDPQALVGHRFRATFDNFSVSTENVLANQLRMARKNFTEAVWEEWVALCRARLPEALWTRTWDLFSRRRDSAEQEREYLMARRQRDERWYAERFQLPWPPAPRPAPPWNCE